jgi:polar amino acid transport system substrate-binding protein
MKGEIDIIAGGMAITPERALKINFSQPYADSGISLATNTGKTRDIKRLEELNQESITIAVVSKTASNELAPRLFNKSTIKVFDTAKEAEQAILNGEAHALLASMPQPEFLALQHPEKVDLPLAKPVMPYKAGFGIKKGEQEWLNFLNAWVTARQADKWLSATHKYWFQSLTWRKESKQ